MIDFCNYKWTTDDGSPLNKSNPWMWHDEMQVWVNSEYYNGKKDWCALLYACKRFNQLQDWDGNIFNPTVACGLLRSVDTFSYGTFSAEIQLPRGKNLWSAFWLVGEGKWPSGGEIDIMEAWSNKCGSYFRATIPQPPYLVPSWDTTTNVHWAEIVKISEHAYTTEHKSAGSRRLPFIYSLKNPTNHFIKYDVEWRQDIITFRVNGKTIRTYGYDVAKHLHDKKMHVIIDMWTTGEDFTCESPMKIRNFEYKPIEIL